MLNFLVLTILSFSLTCLAQDQAEQLEQELDNNIEVLSGSENSKENLESNFLTGAMNASMKKMLEDYLKGNPLSKLPKKEVESMITVRLSGTPVGTMLKKNPKVLDFFVQFLRDKQAIPKAFGIVNKPDKIKKFGFVAIFIFIVGFLLNLKNTEGNILSRIIKKFMIFVGVNAANLGVFYFMFKPNLDPTVRLMLKTIFS